MSPGRRHAPAAALPLPVNDVRRRSRETMLQMMVVVVVLVVVVLLQLI
jgi:predicted nucleic acid-binding Zn ribbon protein